MAPKLIAEFGTFRFNTVRIVMASIMLLLIAGITQTFEASLWQHKGQLMMSGLIGIFIGDTFLFSSVHRLGPRRAGVLFATNAPMSIIIAWLIFDESLSYTELFACGLVTSGAMIAILYGKRKNILKDSKGASLEETKGALWVGVLIALTAALCQVFGAILSKPALLDGADPIAVSAVRVSTAGIALFVAYSFYYHKKNDPSLARLKAISLRSYLKVMLLGFIGMVVGMSVLVWGIGKGNVGIVTTLSATVPVLILPILWISTGQRPAIGAWIGATLVVIGAALIVLY
jgi:drug/metabolite transporter (DMT)-like permease